MRLRLNKAGIIYFGVLVIFLIFVIRGMKEGKILGIDNYVFMVFLLLTRVIYLLVHELSHMFALKSCHLKIREFKIYGLKYLGANQKIKFAVKEFDFSGYVVPWLTYNIASDDNFFKFKSAYIFSLLAGPIFPFVIIFIVYGIGEAYSLPYDVFALTFFINAVLMLLSSFVGNKGSMGDIQAIFYFTKNSNFALQLLEDIGMLKENVSEEEWNYLRKRAREG